MNPPAKRDRLIDAAAELFHKRGMASTSLADIAKHADIPIGNVYYYFKTKDELALAALEKRQAVLANSYSSLDANMSDPRERLIAATRYFDSVRDDYAQFGCPVGKVICDSNDDKDPVARAAAKVLRQFIEWAQRQFQQLGYDEACAQRYATSLLAGIEGAAIMAKAFADPQILSNEVARLVEWLNAVPNKRAFLGKIALKAPEPT